MAVESAAVGSEANEKLTEEITDRILAQMLQEELAEAAEGTLRSECRQPQEELAGVAATRDHPMTFSIQAPVSFTSPHLSGAGGVRG